MKVRKVKVLVAQSCPTLCDPMDCSPPGFSVHGILQAGILEWVAIYFASGCSQPRNQPVSLSSTALAGVFFTTESLRKPVSHVLGYIKEM